MVVVSLLHYKVVDRTGTKYYYVVVHSTKRVVQGGKAVKQTELLKGILEGLVLAIIQRKETYGYEITKILNDQGFTEIVEGTVYTILLRLEKSMGYS